MFKKSAAPAAAAAGYTIAKSLRFRSSASAYLSRSQSNGNKQTWTYSGWHKRGILSTQQDLFAASYYDGSNTYYTQCVWSSSTDVIDFIQYDTSGPGVLFRLTTNAVYRDPSAWYHVVAVFDSTQATASNRVKLYINGSQVTSFSTATYPSQNLNSNLNDSTRTNYIGSLLYAGNIQNYYDGYQAEINFIDGQALTPTSFGSTNSTTGVWQPIAYTGTYGTNGYYLKFTDTTSTTTLCYDYSGNSNNWTPHNISLTAGATYDSMTDVPTLTSATTANYAVMNPLVAKNANAQTLSNGNLTSTAGSSSSAGGSSISTMGMSSGKYYAEFKFSTLNSSGGSSFGIVTSAWNIGAASDDYYWSSAQGYGYSYSAGKKQNNGAETTYGATWTANDVIGIAFDATNGTLEFYKNGTSQGVAFTGIPAGTYYFALYSYNSDVAQANFGQQSFSYTPPSGFVALNTYNLPDSTIVAGNKVMDATTYTGNGSTQTITNAGAFKPDLIWIKSRSNAYNNFLTNSVAGASQYLISNATDAEANAGSAGITAFNTNGFSMGSGAALNANAATYVAWQWQAGQGTTSSNTNGSITSTVSVNATAGFSVVTYTGNGTVGATFGHGLGVAPQFILFKNRTNAVDWGTYHVSTGNTGFLSLDSASAVSTATTTFLNSTTPSSSVVTVGNGNVVNQSTINYVAYCWSLVAGYSAFGTFTGNGTADNSFVYLGFRPKFLLFKPTTGAGGNWVLLDSSRDSYNVAVNLLNPDGSGAEYTASVIQVDFLSNGFKIRGSWAGFTFNPIYAAFAENPFKNALAR